MDKTIYLNNLYDYYQGLLTVKQQQYYEDYYFENLSLSEMAENYKVSRNAVYNQLKLVEKRLEELEKILELYTRRKKIAEILNNEINEKEKKEILELL